MLQVSALTLASVLGSLALGPQWPRSDARPAARVAGAALRVAEMPRAVPPPDFAAAQRDIVAAAAEGFAPDSGLLRSVQLR
jgi:hypothetical protein